MVLPFTQEIVFAALAFGATAIAPLGAATGAVAGAVTGAVTGAGVGVTATGVTATEEACVNFTLRVGDENENPYTPNLSHPFTSRRVDVVTREVPSESMIWTLA